MEDLDCVVHIRISKEQKREAAHDAHQRDMTVSEYTRMLYELGHVLKPRKEDPETNK